MTDQELQEIENDLNAVTEGKWLRYNDETSWVGAWDEENECDIPICECHELEDAMFIAQAPRYVRQLLDEVRRLKGEKSKPPEINAGGERSTGSAQAEANLLP